MTATSGAASSAKGSCKTNSLELLCTNVAASRTLSRAWRPSNLALCLGLLIAVPGHAAQPDPGAPAARGALATPGAVQSDEDEAGPLAADAPIDDIAPVDAKAAAELQFPAGERWLPTFDLDTEVGPQRTFDRRQVDPTRVATYLVKAGETLRMIAYRYCTSPAMVAAASLLAFDPARDPVLATGTQLKVPVRFGAPNGFQSGEQLLTGPGVNSERHDSNWGRPHMVQVLRQVFREMGKRWPMRHPVLVGSLSKPGGGRLGRHKSHRAGQDVDIGYLTYAANMKTWGVPKHDAIDYQRMWYMIDAMEKTGRMAAIYMSPGIQKRLHAYALGHGEDPARLKMLFQHGPKGSRGDTLIRHCPGHRDHFHVRLLGPEDFRGAGHDT